MKTKTIRSLCLLAIALAIVTCTKAESFLDRVSVSPFAALKTANFDGCSTLGAGLDAGVGVNDFVSIHATALAHEAQDWHSSTIDESELFVRARLASFKNEKFSVYTKVGTAHDWNDREWGMAAGAGAELKLSKNIALAGDYTARAYWNGKEKDALTRALVKFTF